MQHIRVRRMQEQDTEAVYAVQQSCYVAAMVEPAALILQRLRQAPDTAWVAADHNGIGAYLVAYRSMRNKISGLGEPFRHAEAADTLYLHDMAVHPRWRGSGVSAQLISCAASAAEMQGLRWLALVSVQDSLLFWQKQGFEPQPADGTQQQILNSYSGPAVYCLHSLLK